LFGFRFELVFATDIAAQSKNDQFRSDSKILILLLIVRGKELGFFRAKACDNGVGWKGPKAVHNV